MMMLILLVSLVIAVIVIKNAFPTPEYIVPNWKQDITL